MDKKIRDTVIAAKDVEFGVRFDDGYIGLCADADEAQLIAAMTGGVILVREVFVAEWSELAE